MFLIMQLKYNADKEIKIVFITEANVRIWGNATEQSPTQACLAFLAKGKYISLSSVL